MTTTPKMPTKQIALGELSGAVVLQTCNIENQTFAYLVEDERFLVAIDGNNKHEDACKEWFRCWFEIDQQHRVKIQRAPNGIGQLFIIQIKHQHGL